MYLLSRFCFQLKEELEEAGDDDAAFKTCKFSILNFVPNHIQGVFVVRLSLSLFSLAIVGSLAIGFVFLTSFFSGILSDRFFSHILSSLFLTDFSQHTFHLSSCHVFCPGSPEYF